MIYLFVIIFLFIFLSFPLDNLELQGVPLEVKEDSEV